MSDFTGIVNIMNNIIRNGEDSGCGTNLAPTNATVVSDANNVVAVSGVVGRYQGQDKGSLREWRTDTRLDTNSFTLDPTIAETPGGAVWVSALPPVDLHFPSETDKGYKVNPLPGITTDVDGQLRDAVSTDVGADEVWPGHVLLLRQDTAVRCY